MLETKGQKHINSLYEPSGTATYNYIYISESKNHLISPILLDFLEALVEEGGIEGIPESSATLPAAEGLKIPAGTALASAEQGDTPSGPSRERGL